FLPAFINRQSGAGTIKEFAVRLREGLNKSIPATVLQTQPSGFHICGYNREGIPEFWFLTNIGGMNEFDYTDLQRQYTEPSCELLGRDAFKMGWDGVNPQSVRNEAFAYRNGDFRAHVSSWKDSTQCSWKCRDFRILRCPQPRRISNGG